MIGLMLNKPTKTKKRFAINAVLQDRSSIWLMSYIALFTSLLAFFLFFMTQIQLEGVDDRRSYQRVIHSLEVSVNQLKQKHNLPWLTVENTLTRGIRMTIELDENLFGSLFEPSSAKLNPQYLPFLQQLADMMQELKLDQANKRYQAMLAPFLRRGAEVRFYVRIEGHTDAAAMAEGGRFSNNVELSSFRAYAMMQYLRLYSRLPREQFAIAGYGSFRLKNQADPLSRENRRVEIYIQPQIYSKQGERLSKGF